MRTMSLQLYQGNPYDLAQLNQVSDTVVQILTSSKAALLSRLQERRGLLDFEDIGINPRAFPSECRGLRLNGIDYEIDKEQRQLIVVSDGLGNLFYNCDKIPRNRQFFFDESVNIVLEEFKNADYKII